MTGPDGKEDAGIEQGIQSGFDQLAELVAETGAGGAPPR